MTGFEAVTLYLGLFGLLFAALKLNCGRVRMATQVNYGEGDNEAMAKAMRVQANAVEDVPIVLLGLIGLAAVSAPVALIHGLGGTFFVGRVLHALGLGSATGTGLPRLFGTIISLFAILITAGACVWFALT
ncbi:MAG: MAPEG family protein [Pseudomonadota bacterium]